MRLVGKIDLAARATEARRLRSRRRRPFARLPDCLCCLWFALARSKNDPREDLVRYSALTITVGLVIGTVLSAQYITWLLPLVPLVVWRRGLVATIAYVVSAALTHAWIRSPTYFAYLDHFDLGATSLLLARNLALLATALALALPNWRTVKGFIGYAGEAQATPSE